jgi:hypothetical protein
MFVDIGVCSALPQRSSRSYAVASLKPRHMVDEPALSRYVAEMASRSSRLRTAGSHPGVEHDQLFEAEYDHAAGEASLCQLSRPCR